MQSHWLSQGSGDKLIVFVLGWGCEELAVKHLAKPLAKRGFDAICFYDYRTVEPIDCSIFDSYKQVYMVAWSFGVFMAEKLFREIHNNCTQFATSRDGSETGGNSCAFRFAKTIAVNGTPFAVDNQHGIPEKSFDVTRRSLKTFGIEKFQQRAMGEYYVESVPERVSIDRLYDELVVLSGLVSDAKVEAEMDAKTRRDAKTDTKQIHTSDFWDCAIVGSRDLIFPPQNMQQYWNSVGVELIVANIPHYPFGKLQTILDVIQDSITLKHEI